MYRVFVGLAVAVAVAIAGSGPVQAQSLASQIKRHVLLANENLDLGDYEGARDQLVAAVQKSETAGLDKELDTAKLHLLLGSVYANGLGDGANAAEQFKRALRIAPGLKLDPAQDTPAARAAYAKAERALSPAGECDTLRGIQHAPVSRAESGVDTEITARAERLLLADTTAFVNFQLDSGSFSRLPMERQGPCGFAATIPGAQILGESLQYYISIQHKDGKVWAMRGNPKSP
ncbi:MAG: tetratricopeptide repeat protein, partial [Myxococcota bacterium]